MSKTDYGPELRTIRFQAGQPKGWCLLIGLRFRLSVPDVIHWLFRVSCGCLLSGVLRGIYFSGLLTRPPLHQHCEVWSPSFSTVQRPSFYCSAQWIAHSSTVDRSLRSWGWHTKKYEASPLTVPMHGRRCFGVLYPNWERSAPLLPPLYVTN